MPPASAAWQLRENVPLAPLTTWKIGGPARFLAEPPVDALPEVLAWARGENLPVWFMGRGSNVLVDENGLPGLVILTRNVWQEIREEDGQIVAEAGVSLPRLAKFAASLGFAGYEFLIGIPGTVGGGVAINAGFKQGDLRDMAHLAEQVETVSPRGEVRREVYSAFHPAYRRTDLLGNHHCVTRVWFRLETRGTTEAIRAETKAHLIARKRKQPLTRPTAGSVFKSTPDGTPAAVFIDRINLKGLRVGDAMVSHKHANWIENVGQATAGDVRALIHMIQTHVRDACGVRLEPEIRDLKAVPSIQWS